MDGIKKAQERGVKFGRKREVTAEKIAEIKTLREAGITVPKINTRKACVSRPCGLSAISWRTRHTRGCRRCRGDLGIFRISRRTPETAAFRP